LVVRFLAKRGQHGERFVALDPIGLLSRNACHPFEHGAGGSREGVQLQGKLLGDRLPHVDGIVKERFGHEILFRVEQYFAARIVFAGPFVFDVGSI
jgi:hypothetical protein